MHTIAFKATMYATLTGLIVLWMSWTQDLVAFYSITPSISLMLLILCMTLVLCVPATLVTLAAIGCKPRR